MSIDPNAVIRSWAEADEHVATLRAEVERLRAELVERNAAFDAHLKVADWATEDHARELAARDAEVAALRRFALSAWGSDGKDRVEVRAMTDDLLSNLDPDSWHSDYNIHKLVAATMRHAASEIAQLRADARLMARALDQMISAKLPQRSEWLGISYAIARHLEEGR